MRSTPNLLTVLTLGLLAVGCQKAYDPVTDRISPAPIIPDPAIDLRHWDQAHAQYANGASVAYPILFPYQPRTNTPEVEQLITGPTLFAGQFVALPLTMLITPPWQETLYRGVYTPPTYTAVPVVASDAQTLQFPPVTAPKPSPNH